MKMEIKVQIKTPPGNANGVEKKLRGFLLGGNKPKEIYTNEDNSELYWVIEGPSRKIMKINKNVAMYDIIISNLLQNKYIKKYAYPRLKEDELKKLKDMLSNQTTVSVVKNATAEEMVEENTTFWDRVRKKFKKK